MNLAEVGQLLGGKGRHLGDELGEVGRARELAVVVRAEILKRILSNVQQISELNEQIAAATYEQSTTFNDVTGHMTTMHRNAEAVMESTDELDGVSRDIQKVSAGLHSVAGQFRV